MTSTVTLRRTGNAPLLIAGELLVEATSHGVSTNRWHQVAIYRTSSGYAVSVNYRTQWQGEIEHHTAEHFIDPLTVVDYLREYDPTRYVAGFPDGAQFQSKQARLLADIRLRYETLVSDVLEQAGEEFAERV